MYTYAKTLWDDTSNFDLLAREYFSAAFGEEGEACRAYMAELSRLFDPLYLRGDRALSHEHGENDEPVTWHQGPDTERATNAQAANRLARVPDVVDEFRPIIERNRASSDPTRAKSWEYLAFHADVVKRLALALRARANSDMVKARIHWADVVDYVQRNEDALQPVLDVYLFVATLGRLFAAADAQGGTAAGEA